MTLQKIQLKKISQFLANIPRIAAEHLFLASLILIFIALLISSAVFYRYHILSQAAEPALEASPVKFQENVYEKIIKEWQDRGAKFDAAKDKQYPDPFK